MITHYLSLKTFSLQPIYPSSYQLLYNPTLSALLSFFNIPDPQGFCLPRWV
jgi:hypothetical protein